MILFVLYKIELAVKFKCACVLPAINTVQGLLCLNVLKDSPLMSYCPAHHAMECITWP